MSIPNYIFDSLTTALGSAPKFSVAKAPGRINLIGEHTDYNNGLVLPGAIDRCLYFAYRPNGTSTINALALDLKDTYTIHLSQLQKSNKLWVNFLIGILIEFQGRGIQLEGFDCAFISEVPMGAGVSSSSALECAILVGLSELFKASQLNNWELIKMSNSSNHNFLEIKGGIMDQFASLFGKENHVMLLDCNSSEYEYVQLPESEYCWLVINSCVKHNHLTSGYNNRVLECQQALADIQQLHPSVKHLSDIHDYSQLDAITFQSDTVRNRAQYVVAENARVRSFVQALKEKAWQACGQLLYDSHQGLSEKYEVSCPELDFLVDRTKELDGVLGARMMGGGFGGSTINLVHKSKVPTIKAEITKQYKNSFSIEPEFIDVRISDGAEIITT